MSKIEVIKKTVHGVGDINNDSMPAKVGDKVKLNELGVKEIIDNSKGWNDKMIAKLLDENRGIIIALSLSNNLFIVDFGAAAFYLRAGMFDKIGGDCMSEWQPIETAPLDGTEVILRFVTIDKSVEVMNGWYNGSWRRVCNNSNSYQYFSLGGVTHWMPLPKPPTE